MQYTREESAHIQPGPAPGIESMLILTQDSSEQVNEKKHLFATKGKLSVCKREVAVSIPTHLHGMKKGARREWFAPQSISISLSFDFGGVKIFSIFSSRGHLTISGLKNWKIALCSGSKA